MCQVEMGQGIYTSISQILADELDVDFSRVVVEAAPPNDALYTNAALGFQVTGGSTSIRVFWMPMRKAGASARAMLVEAAAATWRVDPGSCRTANSEVIHEPSGRRLSVWRAGRSRRPFDAAQEPDAESSQGFSADRNAGATARFTGQGQWRAMFGIDAMPPA
jgi:isoquinoline 1-oxidoreductase beta subunit